MGKKRKFRYEFRKISHIFTDIDNYILNLND